MKMHLAGLAARATRAAAAAINLPRTDTPKPRSSARPARKIGRSESASSLKPGPSASEGTKRKA
ncbi:hypothetical protein, partial [Phaeovulum sp.]|uniref:hypothetical protein n=1 Tax=Phaeovulum sp. TaxID=2934796 RepID=UPI002ABAA25B